MPINIKIDGELLARRFGRPVGERVAKEKRDQLLRESYRHFRDRTGGLRATIRIERGTIVAIGDRQHPYWQYLYRFRRGDGRQWVEQVLRRGNVQALARARNVV